MCLSCTEGGACEDKRSFDNIVDDTCGKEVRGSLILFVNGRSAVALADTGCKQLNYISSC